MNKNEQWESEVDIDQLIREYDETFMPLPDIECEPDLLISKVRKHYMGHMVKILSTNYETNQRLLNKNIYLPSAIWKCAKNLEMKAAQSCMVIQLYRKYVVTMIHQIKTDTEKGRLYNKLYESLHHEPKNEKRTQTVLTSDNGQCHCNEKKRRRKKSSPSKPTNNALILNELKKDSLTKEVDSETVLLHENNNLSEHIQKIPVVTNMQTDHLPILPSEVVSITQPQLDNALNQPIKTPINTESDDLMQQLKALFQDDDDEDDLFTSNPIEDNSKILNGLNNNLVSIPGSTQNSIGLINNTQVSINENHAAQIRSLDERLSTLTGMVTNNEQPFVEQPQNIVQKKPKHASKWLCEEYFLRKNLFELLYQISDNNRQKLARIKELYVQLFGEDNEDEKDVVSPAAESSEFVASCKSRIDGWVMATLAPYYALGRIQGKPLYKAVARHLIALIYKCKPYPSRHEVTSFVMDFLESRGKIRCEADFKEFRFHNVVAAIQN